MNNNTRLEKHFSACSKLILALLLSGFTGNTVFAAAINIPIMSNSTVSEQMFNPYQGVDQEKTLLNLQKSGQIKISEIYLGGSADVAAYYLRSESPSTRWSDQSKMIFPEWGLSSTVALNNNVAAYLQMGAKNIGQTLSTDTTTGQFKVVNAYVLAHQDLSEHNSTLYEFAGNKDIDFGSFASVINSHIYPLANLAKFYFQAHGNLLGAGYTANGLDTTINLINGGNLGADSGLNTDSDKNINNFSVNVSYAKQFDNVTLKTGLGYLNGSSLNFVKLGDKTNPAYDVNSSFSINNIQLLAEYVSTLSDTAETGQKAMAFVTGINYQFQFHAKPTIASLQYSMAKDAIFTGIPDKHERQASYSLAVNQESFKNIWLGAMLNDAQNIIGLKGVNEYAIQFTGHISF